MLAQARTAGCSEFGSIVVALSRAGHAGLAINLTPTPMPTTSQQSSRSSSSPSSLGRIAPGFAAIDIGAEKLFVATANAPVRSYRAFTGEVRALCDWLAQEGVKYVAMEATGVYCDAALRRVAKTRTWNLCSSTGRTRATFPGVKATCAIVSGTQCFIAMGCLAHVL